MILKHLGVADHNPSSMNPANVSQYLDILDKAIKICSAAIPLIALILRKQTPPDPIGMAAGAALFGCLGSVIGLALMLIFGAGAAIFIFLRILDTQVPGWSGSGSIDWGILGGLSSKANLICVSASIGSTLLTFGGDQAKRLAFIAGLSLGSAIALMFLLSTFIH